MLTLGIVLTIIAVITIILYYFMASIEDAVMKTWIVGFISVCGCICLFPVLVMISMWVLFGKKAFK